MFEPIEEWEPIPASELASIGAWDIPDVPGGEVATPAGLDDLIHEAQLTPLGAGTLPLLLATPPELLSDQGRSLGLHVLTKLSRTVDALRAEFTAAIAGPRPASRREAQDDFSPQEVAVATMSSAYAADRQIWLARDLACRLAATAQAMRLGDISLVQATALSEATSHLSVDVARSIEAKVLHFSHRQDAQLFKASLRRWVAKLDPDFSIRAKDARDGVDVEHTAHGDGTGQLYIRGPLEATTTINLALTTYAAKTKDTLGGTADQRTLAGLRDWAESYLGSPGLPTHHGRPPTVNVMIDLASLLGMRDHPADIPGVGPIPASAARWLVADGAPLRRLIIDPTNGRLLDYGQTTYTVPPDLADYLIAQNVRSASPHSSVPAEGCDMEHNTPHHQGGGTDRINATPVDRRWHRAKTHGRWSYIKCRDGTLVWTSPTGVTAQVDPYDYRCGP
jgi:Domain of unknown function (DUF222)